MAKRKGKIVTIGILAAITAASFVLWIPSGGMDTNRNDTTFVVSNYKGYIDGVKNVHEVLEAEVDMEYQRMLNGEITVQEYTRATEVISGQTREKISEFIRSSPSEEWLASYTSYAEALRAFNSYVAETAVLAGVLADGDTKEIEKIKQRIDVLREESRMHVQQSDDSRPDSG